MCNYGGLGNEVLFDVGSPIRVRGLGCDNQSAGDDVGPVIDQIKSDQIKFGVRSKASLRLFRAGGCRAIEEPSTSHTVQDHQPALLSWMLCQPYSRAAEQHTRFATDAPQSSATQLARLLKVL